MDRWLHPKQLKEEKWKQNTAGWGHVVSGNVPLEVTSHKSSKSSHPRFVSVILDIHNTVKILSVSLTAAARVIFDWRLTTVLTY